MNELLASGVPVRSDDYILILENTESIEVCGVRTIYTNDGAVFLSNVDGRTLAVVPVARLVAIVAAEDAS